MAPPYKKRQPFCICRLYFEIGSLYLPSILFFFLIFLHHSAWAKIGSILLKKHHKKIFYFPLFFESFDDI